MESKIGTKDQMSQEFADVRAELAGISRNAKSIKKAIWIIGISVVTAAMKLLFFGSGPLV